MKSIVKIPSSKIVETRQIGRSLLEAAGMKIPVEFKSGVKMTGWIADRSGRVR